MALIKKIRFENVVILANTFNPSIFTTKWLVDRAKVAEEGNISPQSIFSSDVAQVLTNDFSMVVLLNQLQFSKMGKAEGFFDIIQAKLVTMVNLLQEVPYTSVGFNFQWFVEHDQLDISTWTKTVFSNDTKLYSHFNTPDSRLGAYLSKDVGDCRLKLDIKPVSVVNKLMKKEYVQFSFNFEKKLEQDETGRTYADLISFLSKYDVLSKESNNLMVEV